MADTMETLIDNALTAAKLNEIANSKVMDMPPRKLLTMQGSFEAGFWFGYGYAMASAIFLTDAESELKSAEDALRPMLKAMGGADED